MEFWEAVSQVAEGQPNHEEWTWSDWLSVIDLADCPCYHPIRYRYAIRRMARSANASSTYRGYSP